MTLPGFEPGSACGHRAASQRACELGTIRSSVACMISVGVLSRLGQIPWDMAARRSSIIPPNPWAVPAVTMPSNHDHSPLSADQSAVVNDSGSEVSGRQDVLKRAAAALGRGDQFPERCHPTFLREVEALGRPRAGAETETTERIRSPNKTPHAMALGPPPGGRIPRSDQFLDDPPRERHRWPR